ncbi:MAG: DUF3305 domain-containing protein [Gemmobacter sp.]|nr:DUF3305 domain-containing protein [Gemmobacter sp.]
MPRETVRIGIIGRSYPPQSRWGERVLRPAALLLDIPELVPGSLMSDMGGVQTVWLGDHALTLYHTETSHYRSNLVAAVPAVWVSLSEGIVQAVTLDPYEGESLASDPARLVEALEMPLLLRAQVADFIDRYHVEETFKKRKRAPASIESQSDPRAPRILPADQKWIRS